MKILHITFSLSTGGAAIATKRIHEGMLQQKMDSSILTVISSDNVNNHYNLTSSLFLKIRVFNRLNRFFVLKKQKLSGLFSFPLFGLTLKKNKTIVDADVIYFHFVMMGFLNFNFFKRLILLNKKIVFYMHDYWPITGGCHVPSDCNKYQSVCTSCPLLKENGFFSLAQYQQNIKLRLFDAPNVFFVCPSTSMRSQIIKSRFNPDQIIKIPNPVNTSIYKPLTNVEELKNKYKINTESKILLYVASELLSIKYKGWDILEQVLIKLKAIHKFQLVILGLNKVNITEELENITLFVPPTSEAGVINSFFNMADVTLFPSKSESFGLVPLESISSGTPVVAFDSVGAINDIIVHKVNGYISKRFEIDDFLNGILFFLENSQTKESISSSVSSYDSSLVALQHKEFLNSIIK